MSTRKNKPPLKLEMDFDEALHRFAKTDLKETLAKIADDKKRQAKVGEKAKK